MRKPTPACFGEDGFRRLPAIMSGPGGSLALPIWHHAMRNKALF
jgi:hypothetical protein